MYVEDSHGDEDGEGDQEHREEQVFTCQRVLGTEIFELYKSN